MKIAAVLFAFVFVACTVSAQARERRSDTRDFDGFRTGHCKTSTCYAKHPGGSYVYPNHYGRRR